jgi:hypothetical protein
MKGIWIRVYWKIGKVAVFGDAQKTGSQFGQPVFIIYKL